MTQDSKLEVRDVAALAAIAAFFAGAWLLVAPRADVPVIDDWVYAWSVEHLLRTGQLRVLEFSAIYPLTQIAWGALFARFGGFSFVTLRLSTVVLSVAGCWAIYLTMRELACGRASSLLAAFALACNPVFFALSFSFMTDVPFVDLSAIAMLFYVKAVRRDRPMFLWIGGAAAVLAFLVRPLGIVLPLTVVPVLLFRRDWRAAVAGAAAPVVVPVAVMATMEFALPRALGALDWANIRGQQLQWWFSIAPTTYLNWTIRLVLESVFPLAPLLIAPLVGWRRMLVAAAVAAALFVPVRRARGEIPPPLPDWQTWSMQDIGARSVLAGDATSSPWSVRVMPVLRGLGLLTAASFLIVLARGVFAQPRWSRGHIAVLMHALLLVAAIHALWLYNDRYYLVLAPPGAIIAAAALDRDTRARWAAVVLLLVWAAIAVTGTRDLLGYNEACADEARRLEASGVRPYDIDAGYPWNGWHLYAHPENLPPGADPRFDVPFVTSDRSTPFAIMSHPTPGTTVVRVVPLPRATWQATREVYVVKR